MHMDLYTIWVLKFRKTLSCKYIPGLEFVKVSCLSNSGIFVVEPQQRLLETFEGSEITDVNFICMTTTSLPYNLPSIEKTMEPLGTDSIHLEFATGVFEASELDTVRTQNDASNPDLQMLLRYAYYPLGF